MIESNAIFKFKVKFKKKTFLLGYAQVEVTNMDNFFFFEKFNPPTFFIL